MPPIKAVKMPCPKCGHEADCVVDTTKTGGSQGNARGWQCKNCGFNEILNAHNTQENIPGNINGETLL
jgi:predicted nucleic-acid-binding Zn-ribbon protein